MANDAALILEGGGMRGIFTGGVLDFLTEKSVSFSYVVGVSAESGIASRSVDTFGYFVCMFGVAAVLMVLATVGQLHYYLFAVWFVAVTAVSIYAQKLIDEKKGFGDLIFLAVCLFALLNLKCTYGKAIDCKDNLKPYEEVTEFMRSEGLYYGYAEFWDADRLAVITDGELVFGCSYYMEDLGMYCGLPIPTGIPRLFLQR